MSRSRSRAVVFLGLSLVAGLAATLLVVELSRSYDAAIERAREREPMVTAIVAAGDLFPGVAIAESDIAEVQVPKSLLPPDGFTSPELVVGQIPHERILANELVRGERLADSATMTGLNALVPLGMRAMSIDLADGAALQGLLQAGSFVDVLVTLPATDGDEPKTYTILQNVPVLAVDAHLARELEGASPDDPRRRQGRPTVTLALVPGGAEVLAHAQELGTITLAARGAGDAVLVADDGGMGVRQLLGMNDDPPAPPPTRHVRRTKPDDTPTVQLIRGTQSSRYTPPADAP